MGQRLQPMGMPSDKATNDTLQPKTGADYHQTFYRMIVRHHQEGKMMDEFIQRVQRADVRQLIDKMRADPQRGIRELEAKPQRRG